MSGTSSRVITLPITILSGQTTSEAAWAWKSYGGSAGLAITSPAALTGTVKIQVTQQDEPDSASAVWTDWYNGSPAVQINVPAVGTTVPFVELVLNRGIRFVSTLAEGANRTFILSMQATN